MINLDKYICKAKRVDTGEWVYGYYVSKTDPLVGCAYPYILCQEYNSSTGLLDSFITWYRVDPNTVCRCTGWHDSNKTPIFEKDIIEFVGPGTHRDLIWWCNEMSMMTAIPLDGIKFNGYDYWNGNYPKYTYADFCFMMQDPYGDFREIKVVGNIVDNPELLEVTK